MLLALQSGGVLRDNSGKWIVGYARVLGSCSTYIVELWGVLNGLILLGERFQLSSR